LGNLSEPECIPQACNVDLPENSEAGACPTILQSGERCEPRCKEGYALVGQLVCSLGKLFSPRCAPEQCNVSEPQIQNGGLGACPEILADGQGCILQCDPGYHAFGETSCSRGDLVRTQCLVKLNLMIETQNTAYAGSKSAASASFRVDGAWQSEGFFESPVKRGRQVSRTFALHGWPTLLRLTPLLLDDGWGIRQIVVTTNGAAVTVLGAADSSDERANSLYWLKKSADGGGIREYTVPAPKCRLAGGFLATPPCEDGSTSILSGRRCKLMCQQGYYASVDSVVCSLGALAPDFTCLESPCDLTAPLNGGFGDCPTRLKSRENCTNTCEPGYTSTGDVSCLLGETSNSTCQPKKCTFTPPINGSRGNCPLVLLSGQTCSTQCDHGYMGKGYASCHLGVLTRPNCFPMPCQVPLIANGSRGSCPDVLPSNATCTPSCDSGYSLEATRGSGLTYCSLGALTLNRCIPNPCSTAALVNTSVGDCPLVLPSGTSCRPVCGDGYTTVGVASCSLGVLSQVVCSPNSCLLTAFPRNGSRGIAIPHLHQERLVNRFATRDSMRVVQSLVF